MASARHGQVLHTYRSNGGVSCRLPFYSNPWPTHPPSDGAGICCKSLFFFQSRPSSTPDGLKRRSNFLEPRHGKSLFLDARGGVMRPASLPETSTGTSDQSKGGGEEVIVGGGGGGKREGQGQEDGRRGLGKELSIGAVASAIEEAMPRKDFNIIAACVIGLFTGIGVVLFNGAVHEIRDAFWDGIPARGASWLREEPLGEIWQRVILVPACGGVIVGLLNKIRSALETQPEGSLPSVKGIVRPFLKAVAAAVTLGTGNSLGPEGPSVEIGASIAKGVGTLFDAGGKKNLSLVAAGSAAGISSGFNAAVAGCFFAVESVLWPSAADSTSSVTNTTSVVILSAVIASVISEIGLGSDPAFTVPEYDFRSPGELPLYLLLGILCGLVSLVFSRCTSYAKEAVDYVHETTGIAKAIFPALGGLTVGIMALAYPEVLYWGFENVDVLLESRPFVAGLPAYVLLQLVGVKIVATSLSRAFGLVGGYYAPSLFIGAATGMAYGKFIGSTLSGTNPLFQLPIFEVASAQAYGLVGMAATLAGVCQVPLTAVLLLFGLTQDYRIVLPLLGAVGLSSLIASTQNRKRSLGGRIDSAKEKTDNDQQPSGLINASQSLINSTSSKKGPVFDDLCDLESSLCVYEFETRNLAEKLTVSQAMRTTYVTVLMNMSLLEAVNLMLCEKQSCAVVVEEDNYLVGLLSLEDISRATRIWGHKPEVEKLLVSDICCLDGNTCQVQAATPKMTLLSAENVMDLYGVSQLPVVSEHIGRDKGGHAVGLLDRECIEVSRRAYAAKEFLGQYDEAA